MTPGDLVVRDDDLGCYILLVDVHVDKGTNYPVEPTVYGKVFVGAYVDSLDDQRYFFEPYLRSVDCELDLDTCVD